MSAEVADYTLVQPLGPAAFGQLWVARAPERLHASLMEAAAVEGDERPGPDGLVGLKVVELLDDQAFDRAVRELRVLADMRSRYVVRPLDAGHSRTHLFYAFPLPHRGTLAAPVAPLSRAARIAAVADMARGAHDLHNYGVAHRNIKPGTGFLMNDRAVLGDVGLAAPIAADRSVLGPLGAAEFTDPEVLRGGPATRATDLYSLGMTLRWALAEVPALPLDRSELSLLRHAVRGVPDVAEVLDDEEAAVVARCVDPDPTARPPSAADLADELDRLVLLEGAPDPTPNGPDGDRNGHSSGAQGDEQR